MWSNSVLKYGSLSDADFDIESVRQDYTAYSVLPPGYEEIHPEQAPESKIRSQRRLTAAVLKDWIASRSSLS
jgi:hypothetical protein